MGKVPGEMILYCILISNILGIVFCTVQYCTVLYSTVLYCNLLYCTIVNYTLLKCTLLYCTVIHGNLCGLVSSITRKL